MRRGGGDDDAVEGGMLGPATVAVPMADAHVVAAEPRQAFAAAVASAAMISTL